jgi:Apoptosis antagonizing transcription factor
MQGFLANSRTLSENLTKGKKEVSGYIKDLTTLQKELFALSETEVKTKTFPDHALTDNESTSDSMFEVLDHNFKQVLPFVEGTVDRWNTRTQTVLKNNAKQ